MDEATARAGNSASGAPFGRPLLPGLWRTIGGVLPPGASLAPPILVLAVWAGLGTALALGGRIMDPVDVETEAAAGAAV